MKKPITAVVLALLTMTAFGASQKMTCRETGKKIDKCCCDMKDGKFYCKLRRLTTSAAVTACSKTAPAGV